MPTAADNTQTGQTTVRTTTVRTLPADPLSVERKTPEFWSYLQSLKADDWDKHIVYVYRRFDTGPSQPLEKCAVYFVMPDGTKVPLANQEELEIAIAQTYGGGSYRVWIKKGSERISETRITIDGPAKNTQPGILRNIEQPPANGQQPVAASTDVATTAMHLVANQEAQGLRIGMEALHSAADVVQRLAHQATPVSQGQGQGDDLEREFKRAMIARMLAPPPDPIAMFQQFATLMATLTGGSGGVNPTVTKIIDSAVERLMNPLPSGPASSAGAELVRVFPQVAGYAVEGLKEWRLGTEAQERAIVAQTSAQTSIAAGRPARGAPTAILPPAPNRVAAPPPAAPAAQTPEASTIVGPNIEFLEVKIIELLKRPISAEEAADECLAFLDLANPALLEQLLAQVRVHGEAGLMNLFQTRPILSQAISANLPRLKEFIAAFVKYSRENEAEAEADPAAGPIDGTKIDKTKLQ